MQPAVSDKLRREPVMGLTPDACTAHEDPDIAMPQSLKGNRPQAGAKQLCCRETQVTLRGAPRTRLAMQHATDIQGRFLWCATASEAPKRRQPNPGLVASCAPPEPLNSFRTSP